MRCMPREPITSTRRSEAAVDRRHDDGGEAREQIRGSRSSNLDGQGKRGDRPDGISFTLKVIRAATIRHAPRSQSVTFASRAAFILRMSAIQCERLTSPSAFDGCQALLKITSVVMLNLVFLLNTASIASSAPEITGSWQGTLVLRKPLRIVLKIAKGSDGALTAKFYSIDQSPEAFDVEPITFDGQRTQFSVPAIGGTFKGNFSPDGMTIDGKWSQMRSTRLVFTRATKKTAWATDHVIGTQFISVEDDVRLEVLDWGGTGRPVILLAGMGSTAHVFDAFATKLRANYHVYGITRRGFGNSSRPVPSNGNYNADRLGDDVLAVIDALKISRPILIGWSIAGEELSSIGTRHPDAVSGLVYLDAGYSYAFFDPQYAMKNPPAGSMPAIDQAIVDGEQKYAGPINVPVLAIYAAPHIQLTMPGRGRAATAAAEAKDLARTSGQAKAFQRGVPSARVVLLAHADHAVFMSNEADVIRELGLFAASLH